MIYNKPQSLSIITSTLLLFANLFTQAQVNTKKIQTLFGTAVSAKTITPSENIVRCGTVEYEKYLQQKDKKRYTESQFESWINPLVNKQAASRKNAKTAATIITIPVVVHVIHSGQAIGVAPNITDAQVQSQLTVLNQDFRRMLGTPGYNNNAVGADIEVEFVLAKTDPNGNPTNGIDRVNLCQDGWDDADIEETVKPNTIWDANQYMNVWSLKFVATSNLLGYAKFPNASSLSGLPDYSANYNTDGVVINYKNFGSIAYNDGTFILPNSGYNRGRTLTHEVGHFFGLRHIWGDGGSRDDDTKNCTASDFCADTPQAGWENYSCFTSDSCPDSAGNDMVENYMDYTTDACLNIFTQNQKDRMLTVLENSPRRSSLKTSTKGNAATVFANDAELKITPDYCALIPANCTALPVATNKKISLINQGTSTLTAATIEYSLNGGFLQTQNWQGSLAPNQSAVIELANTNFYGVLNASITSANGTTDQRASNNAVTQAFSPLNYTFTDYKFTLQLDYWGSEINWSIKDGSGTVLYKGGPYSDKPENSGLPTVITQNWTLPNNQCYTFEIIDKQKDGVCCGGGIGYYNLKSSDGTTTLIAGDAFGKTDSLFFTTTVLSGDEFENTPQIFIYPNPTDNVLNIQIPAAFGLPKSYIISDVSGQKIRSKVVVSENDLQVNTSNLSNGVYFITIERNGYQRTLRFIK